MQDCFESCKSIDKGEEFLGDFLLVTSQEWCEFTNGIKSLPKM